MDFAWLESGVGWSLCFENREISYPDFCLGFMHVFFFFLLTFMVLFINASHQFRYNCTFVCTHTWLLWLEGKSFMSSIASSRLCQGGRSGILQWMHIRLHVNREPLLALGGWAAVGRMQLHPELRKAALSQELTVAVVALITHCSWFDNPSLFSQKILTVFAKLLEIAAAF